MGNPKRIFLCGLFMIMIFIPMISFSQSDSHVIEKQDTVKQYIVITTKDITIIGTIENLDANPLIIQTEYGVLNIPKDQVEKIKELEPQSIKKGKYWFPNPNTSRLFFAPTARMLKKGEGYFADYYLFFPGISYGISNNFTLNGGFSILPGVNIFQQIFYLAPKFGIFTKGKWHVAAGGLFARPGDFADGDIPTVGILYGVTTYGNNDSGFTLGLGYGFADDEMADKPVVILGGETRGSRRISFVTENWIIPGVDPVIVSYGLRFLGEKMAVDLAFITAIESGALFPGFPMVDFVFNF
ncbi:hypothetical protein ACFL4L_02770 [bacterium]